MAIYKTKNGLIFTNLKVMSSALNNTLGVKQLTRLGIVIGLFKLQLKYYNRKNRTILLVRCPYEKAISVYFNKFKSHKWVTRNGPTGLHHVFLKYIDSSKEWDTDSIISEFESLTFDKYLEVLLEVNHLDAHTWPQIKLMKRFFLKPEQFEIVKLEDKSNLNRVFEQLRIVPPHTNISKKTKLELNESQKEIIFSIYKDDFILFNYSK